MSFILNEYEVDRAYVRFGYDTDRPNLRAAVETLANLVDWTNLYSDGWPYWSKPAAASKRLQEEIAVRLRVHDETDIPLATLRKAFTPIKAFRTRFNNDRNPLTPAADFAIILPGGIVE